MHTNENITILWSKNKPSFASEPNLVLFSGLRLNDTPQEAQKDQLFLLFSRFSRVRLCATP